MAFINFPIITIFQNNIPFKSKILGLVTFDQIKICNK